jgi:hypothetical protein
MKRISLVCLVVVAGCNGREQIYAQEDARFNSFLGLTMAEFMQKTHVVPSNAYPVGGGRMFVADKRNPLNPNFGCSMLITTEANGAGSTAEGWTITAISRDGGCGIV